MLRRQVDLKRLNKFMNNCISQYQTDKKCYYLYDLCDEGIYHENYDFFIWNKRSFSRGVTTTIKTVEFPLNNINRKMPLKITTNNLDYIYDYLLLYPKNFKSLPYSTPYPLMENNLMLIPSYYFLIDGKLPKNIKIEQIQLNPMYFDLFLKEIIEK